MNFDAPSIDSPFALYLHDIIAKIHDAELFPIEITAQSERNCIGLGAHATFP
jgi:hypothetical protein